MRALIFSIVLALACARVDAAQLSGEYVLGGNGSVVVTFDGAGNFVGLAAFTPFGLANIQGTALVAANHGISGTFTLTDRQTLAPLYTGTLTGAALPNNSVLRLTLLTPRAQSFTGGPRTGLEPAPGGLYFTSSVPTSLLVQCARSANRQLVTIQGDQDYGLDYTQAVGGQLLFNQLGAGFGVVYENSDPTSPPRWAVAKYNARRDTLALALFQTPLAQNNGYYVTATLSGYASAGKYDGIYTANLIAGTPGAMSTVSVKLTVKYGVVTGSDLSTGAITGTVLDNGIISFTTQKLVVPAPSSVAGTYNGTITYTGGASASPVFPQMLDGTFSGAGVSGAFNISEPKGITGATSPPGLPRAETWTGTLTGTHRSPLCAGGIFGENYTFTLTLPSSLVAAMRGKSQLFSGSGSFSGTESIKTQAPFPTGISAIVASTMASTSVTVTFAGVYNGLGSRLEFYNATTALIPGKVHLVAGPNANTDQFENRQIIRLAIGRVTPLAISGVWQDGTFILKKQ